LSDFCSEPRASNGTISEVAGMPIPRTEGGMLEHCCCRIGSKRAAEEVKTVMWDRRLYLSTGDFDAGLIAAVATRLRPRRSYLSIQPQPRLWHTAYPHLHALGRSVSTVE
jgi:hypothetical protein